MLKVQGKRHIKNPDEAVMPMVQFQGDLLNQDYDNNLAQYIKVVKNIISDEEENKYKITAFSNENEDYT